MQVHLSPGLLTGIFLALMAAILLFAAAFYGTFYGKDGTPFTDHSTAPAEVVKEFGTHMKNVPLLAPKENVDAAMDKEYASLVLPETLAAWKADPSRAPGRFTSSPWPDHIEIATSTKTEEGYRVEGLVVELTSDTSMNGGEGTSYPVVFTLKKDDSKWKIATFERTQTITTPIPTTSSLTGTYVCLPHKDRTGPQTMECAFGIQTTDATYYALDFSAFTSDRGMTLATGERIRVQGDITPLSALPKNDRLRIYDIEGVVHVQNLTSL